MSFKPLKKNLNAQKASKEPIIAFNGKFLTIFFRENAQKAIIEANFCQNIDIFGLLKAFKRQIRGSKSFSRRNITTIFVSCLSFHALAWLYACSSPLLLIFLTWFTTISPILFLQSRNFPSKPKLISISLPFIFL